MEEHADLLPPSDGDQHYKVYANRWFMLVWFSLSSAANAIAWITFSPISDKVIDFYDQPSIMVDLLSLVFMIVYVPLVFPASWSLDQMGLRFGMVIGTFTTVLGVWIRVIGEWSFWPILVGQIVAAVGQPFILNAPPKLAANWFPDHQRTIATTIASVANPIGVGIGFLLPPLLAPHQADIPFMLLIEAAIISGMCIPLFLLFRSAPPTPPSTAAARESGQLNFLTSLKMVLSDVHFWNLILQFSLGLGAYNTLATVVNQLVEPYGYSNTDSGIMGALTIVCGIIGSAIVGLAVDYTHWYKSALVLCLALGTGAAVMMTLFLAEGNLIPLCVAVALLGFTVTPVLPVALELGCEMAYPVGEALPTGLLLVGGQIAGIGLVFLLNWFIDEHKEKAAGWATAACLGASGLAACIMFPTLRRRNYERQHRDDDPPSSQPSFHPVENFPPPSPTSLNA